MPRICTICEHAEREAIDRALVGGASNRSFAALYGVSESAARRHKGNHLPAKLAKAHEAEEVAHADGLLADVRSLQARTLAILETAELSYEHRTALAAIREARSNLELLAKLMGELDERPSVAVNLNVSAEWLQLRTVLVTALDPYPDAQAAVVGAIEGGGNV
jgi:hypothetical protein